MSNLDSLPLELVDKLCEYLPLPQLVMFSRFNDRFVAATERQFRLRATSIHFSYIHSFAPSTLNTIFQAIGPHLRQVNVDVPQTDCIRACLRMCPNVDALTFSSDLVPLRGYDLSAIRSLVFQQIGYISDGVVQTYMNSCSDRLESLVIDNTHLLGLVLDSVPLTLRRLHLIRSHIDTGNIVKYLKSNPYVEDFFMQSEIFSARLPDCLPHLREVRKLGLSGTGIVCGGVELLATLPHLVELDIQIIDLDFADYPNALDGTQRLRTLNLAFDFWVVDQEFAESFLKFVHLTRLSIYIGHQVEEVHLLVQPLVELSKRAKLQSVVLAGFTDGLDLANNWTLLKQIPEVRVCDLECECDDHYRGVYG